MRRGVFIRAITGSGPKAGIIFFLMALFACQVALAAEHKRVMLLHSFGQDFKPWSEYAKDIRAELKRQSPWPLDIIENSLVTARFSDEDPEAPFVEYLTALFAKRPLDVIVSIGAPAADFVQRHPVIVKLSYQQASDLAILLEPFRKPSLGYAAARRSEG